MSAQCESTAWSWCVLSWLLPPAGPATPVLPHTPTLHSLCRNLHHLHSITIIIPRIVLRSLWEVRGTKRRGTIASLRSPLLIPALPCKKARQPGTAPSAAATKMEKRVPLLSMISGGLLPGSSWVQAGPQDISQDLWGELQPLRLSHLWSTAADVP